MNRQSSVMISLLAGSLALSACSGAPDETRAPASAATTPQTGVAQPEMSAPVAASTALPAPVSDAGQKLPTVLVHKSASCGCCGSWVDHLRADGFQVEVRNTEDLSPIKQRLGVPVAKGSCHTAQVGGYFVEGHVPASDIRRLLLDKPDAKGLVLPGMPMGSPGMEAPDGRVDPYTVELVGRDGSTSAFAEH